MNQKGFTPILLVLLTGLVLVGGFVLYQNQNKIKPGSPTQTSQSSPKFSDTSNWNVYKDEQGKFSFSHPAEFKVIPSFLPSSQYKNSWKIVKNQQTDQDYVMGKSIDVIILENQDFEVRKSDKYQDVVYSKELGINGFKAMQQILVGKPTDMHASDSTVVITQIKDSSGKNLISFTTGLYKFIQDRTAYFGTLNEENYLNIIQRDLSTYNKIISTFKFTD